MEKSIQTSKGEFKVKEISIDEGLSMDQSLSGKDETYDFVVRCLEPKMSIEDFKKLSMTEGVKIITACNEVNGLLDFQKPTNTN